MIHKLRIKPHHWLALAFALLAGILLFFALSPKAHSTITLIDTHEHIQSLARAEDLLSAMDDLGIEKTVLIPSPIETLSGSGDGTFTHYRENVDEILKIAEKHPTRFVPFCTLNPKDKDALDFLKDCVKRGGKGLKLYNGHPTYFEALGGIDAKAMEPIYSYADEIRLPLLFHVNLDDYGLELESVLRKHPNMIVSVPHFMATSSLARAGRLMDQYSNLYTDISFGFEPYMALGFENIRNNTAEFRDFVLKHQDRILFGADMVLTDSEGKDTPYMKAMLGCYKNLVEKSTFQCDTLFKLASDKAEKLEAQAETCKPKSGKFCHLKTALAVNAREEARNAEQFKGLDIPAKALELLYSKNAERFLNPAANGKP